VILRHVIPRCAYLVSLGRLGHQSNPSRKAPTLARLAAVAEGAIEARADKGEELLAALDSASVECIAESGGEPG
jgi:hypothetical protein